jgi:hypothetical protein
MARQPCRTEPQIASAARFFKLMPVMRRGPFISRAFRYRLFKPEPGQRGLAGSPLPDQGGDPAALIGFLRTGPLAGLRARDVGAGQADDVADNNVCPAA